MINIFIHSLNDIEKKELEKYHLLEKHWDGPLISSSVDEKRWDKKVKSFILKKGKKIAKERKILNDIYAIVTSTNFTRIFSERGHNYITVDFYESNQRYLNP